MEKKNYDEEGKEMKKERKRGGGGGGGEGGSVAQTRLDLNSALLGCEESSTSPVLVLVTARLNHLASTAKCIIKLLLHTPLH